MRTLGLYFGLLAPIFASCPQQLQKCSYHNHYYVPKVDTEWRNGKQFGIYEHDYTDDQGKRRKCRIVVECSK